MTELPEEEVKAGAPEWVVTFGDMMSLLLTFFVLLLSFSSTEASKFKIIAGYMREAFGVQSKDNYSGVPMGTTILSTDTRTQDNSSDELELIRAIRQELDNAKASASTSVEKTDRGVAVRVKGEVLFLPGRSEIRPEAHAALDGIAAVAAERSGILEIEGHSDNRPISTSRYPSNWELSSARAGSTARYLIQQGVPSSRIKAVGYSDTRPIVPNDSAENRTLNRRVEFLFVRDPQSADSPTAVDVLADETSKIQTPLQGSMTGPAATPG